MTVQTTERPHRRLGFRVSIALMAIAALVTVVLYATTGATNTVSVSPPGTTSGGKVDISTVGATFSGIRGKATVAQGVVLAKLTFDNSDYSDDIVIHFVWADPDEAAGVLLNPNAFLNSGVYFLDTDQQSASEGGYTGSCDTTTQRSFDDGGTKYACPDTDDDRAHKILSAQMAGTVFQPTLDAQAVLYILADISVPGGAPPGVQSELSELRFNVTAN